MGIAATNARLTFIIAYQNDLEFAMQMLTQKRISLAYTSAEASKSDDYTEVVASLQSLDKALELETTRLSTQQKMVSTEYETVKKTLENNITRSMKGYVA